MNTNRNWLRAIALPALALTLASCSETSPRVTAPDEARLGTTTGATLLECPVDQTQSASATIGALGGTLELNGHRVDVPLNAVTVPTKFTLTVPASNYMEVDFTADGQQSFQFSQPVTITISYERCTRSNVEKENLRIFHIDSGTKAVLEDLGGTDDKVNRKVTTQTDHFTGYSIGTS